ncbi:hypothetical protein EYC80_002694 [Monilinia laxa]|uniref:Uncharacterized protein n=1 Tax=Monilinia laxa TaxID=61186 RepID=A0A5N6K4P3_MONLA|nr:hypothetical protein EYC80_002694 [Monilinia laxa]
MLWLLWWVEQNDWVESEDWLDADLEIDLEWCGLGIFDLEMEDMVMCVRSGLMLGWFVGECAVFTAYRWCWNWNWNIPRAEILKMLCFWNLQYGKGIGYDGMGWMVWDIDMDMFMTIMITNLDIRNTYWMDGLRTRPTTDEKDTTA